jgi:hypothetical protein
MTIATGSLTQLRRERFRRFAAHSALRLEWEVAPTGPEQGVRTFD